MPPSRPAPRPGQRSNTCTTKCKCKRGYGTAKGRFWGCSRSELRVLTRPRATVSVRLRREGTGVGNDSRGLGPLLILDHAIQRQTEKVALRQGLAGMWPTSDMHKACLGRASAHRRRRKVRGCNTGESRLQRSFIGYLAARPASITKTRPDEDTEADSGPIDRCCIQVDSASGHRNDHR
jgi:hypothetical protein